MTDEPTWVAVEVKHNGEPVTQEAIDEFNQRHADGLALALLVEAMPKMPKPYGWSWELAWDPEDIPPDDYIIFVHNALDDDPVASGFGTTVEKAANDARSGLMKWLDENPDFKDADQAEAAERYPEDDPATDHQVDEPNGGYRA